MLMTDSRASDDGDDADAGDDDDGNDNVACKSDKATSMGHTIALPKSALPYYIHMQAGAWRVSPKVDDDNDNDNDNDTSKIDKWQR